MTDLINTLNHDEFNGARKFFHKFIAGCRKAKTSVNDPHLRGIVDSIMDFATATMIECEGEFTRYVEEEATAMGEK